MNFNQNQIVFEEFQRSVDQAKILAQKLGPEHFYLAYDRCVKLQKVIFKRACGYCFTSNDANDNKMKGINGNKEEVGNNFKNASTGVSYVNFPSFSLCGSSFPLLISGQSALNSRLDCVVKKLIMLKQYTETMPSEEEEALLDKEGCVINQPRVSISESLNEMLEKLIKYFPDFGDVQYELCLPQTANPVLLVSLSEEEFSKLQNSFNGNLCFLLRPTKTVKMESSMPSPLALSGDHHSAGLAKINSFMADADKSQMSDDNAIAEPCDEFSETIFSSDAFNDTLLKDDAKPRSTRRYNWSVVLSNLHENHPTELRNESVRFPEVCHELHSIPPTPQKLRPTKRCQLCLKGYKSRKESRYYCRPCDKGFHIKCFEVYHQQLGYVQYKSIVVKEASRLQLRAMERVHESLLMNSKRRCLIIKYTQTYN